eukprot:360313-Chlamydomonas_euryale.AAC.5
MNAGSNIWVMCRRQNNILKVCCWQQVNARHNGYQRVFGQAGPCQFGRLAAARTSPDPARESQRTSPASACGKGWRGRLGGRGERFGAGAGGGRNGMTLTESVQLWCTTFALHKAAWLRRL